MDLPATLRTRSFCFLCCMGDYLASDFNEHFGYKESLCRIGNFLGSEIPLKALE